jgi:hypothetical protein
LAAVAAAATTSAALLAAAMLNDPRHPQQVWSAGVVSAMAAVWAVSGWRRAATRQFEVAIGEDGSLLARRRDSPDAVRPGPSRTVFVAPWLITLQRGAMLVPIWSDSVDPDAFRRLHACARWAGMADSADSGIQDEHRTGNFDDAPR